MMKFDEQGYITPYDVQEVTMKNFEGTFATNESRQSLLVEYNAFVEHLNSLGIINFYQWIDGSFVTKK